MIVRQLVTHTFCDVCDERTPADESLSIAIVANGKPKRIDLCTEHKDPSWSTITAHWIDDLDAPTPPTAWGQRLNERTLVCDICGKRAAKSERGMARHTVMMHPGADRAAPPSREVTETECPECGATFGSAHATKMHRVRKHGWTRTTAP